MITGLFSAVVCIGLFFVAQFVADRLREARPLPPVTQRELPPLPGAYAEDVRIRIPSSRGRRIRAQLPARQGVAGQLRSLVCEGYCAGLTRHEDAGDGTSTCRRCGTPRSTALDDGA